MSRLHITLDILEGLAGLHAILRLTELEHQKGLRLSSVNFLILWVRKSKFREVSGPHNVSVMESIFRLRSLGSYPGVSFPIILEEFLT